MAIIDRLLLVGMVLIDLTTARSFPRTDTVAAVLSDVGNPPYPLGNSS